MHESNHNRDRQSAADGEHIHHDPGPYWKRAHHDWRFWIGMVLMLVAVTVYFMSDDLSLIPSSQPQPAAHAAKR